MKEYTQYEEQGEKKLQEVLATFLDAIEKGESPVVCSYICGSTSIRLTSGISHREAFESTRAPY